ncbi:hypothetical protein [Engelhardtia mirabilis]|uniref:FG-GAP repeat protein n=1 Tax=Engelhardtia mirabilis TaxID=2528011 RepID=A0A518BJQ4_9BACT|nr:hypothetical protein Pla133_22870 [Planctomycetes bacterium Pla133]QDV01536.1 hypothetical protein Pla86_22870 [Planctomycetes bacterium Pla86]
MQPISLLLRHGSLLLAALATSSVAAAQCPLQHVTDFGGSTGDEFGRAIAVHGDVAVFSAHRKAHPGATSTGSLFVYLRDGQGQWQFSQELTAPPTETVQGFGRRVAIADDFLVTVGVGNLQGGSLVAPDAIYVFDRVGDEFTFEERIVTAAVPAAAALVRDLAADGDHFVAGFPFNPSGVGYARIYGRQSGTWSLEGQFGAFGQPPKVHGDNVDIRGERCVVTSNENLVFIYDRNTNGDWFLSEQVLLSLCTPDTDLVDLAFDGELIAVSLQVAAGAPDPGCGARVDVLAPIGSGGSYNLLQQVPQPFGTPSEAWGESIDLDEGRLAVGSSLALAAQGGAHGKVYLYQDGVTGFEPAGVLTPSWPPSNTTEFGSNVAVSGDTVAVGAYLDDSLEVSAGSGSLWSFAGVGCPDMLGVPWARSISFINASAAPSGAGRQDLLLDAGPDHAGELYLVLGSVSGTAPGIPFGGVLIPLVLDAWTLATLSAPNLPPLESTFGVLDGDGRALAALDLQGPLDPVLAGLTLHHAFVTIDAGLGLALTSASQATPLTLVP